MTAIAILVLVLAIVLFGSTIFFYLKTAYTETSRVEEIRHLRQEGLAVNQEGE